jgi:predicted aspartyl protease
MHVDLEVMRELDGMSGIVNVEVDTGSNDSALPRPFLRKLGIRPVGWEWYELADGRKVRRQYGVAFLRLMGRVGASRVLFARPKDPPLLGRIALAQLGFELEPKREILRNVRDG